tara:strand:- start:12212 stop:12748 length:537 start_codon:yes stop_codon:yes gene_type:complete
LNTNSDFYLLNQISKDDYDAFNQLYEKYWEDLYVYAYRLTSDKENAFIIIQDLFVMLWEKRRTHKIETLKSYLFSSVKYQYFELYRKNKVSLENVSEQLADYVFDNLSEANPEILEILKKGLEELPEKRKEILLMNKYQNLSAQEISEILNISVQTVRNQLSSALTQLRLYFSKTTRR